MSSSESDEGLFERPAQRARHLWVPDQLTDPDGLVYSKIRMYVLMLVEYERKMEKLVLGQVKNVFTSLEERDIHYPNLVSKAFPSRGQKGPCVVWKEVFVGLCTVCFVWL